MADTLDLISSAEAKLALNIDSTDTSQDTELAAYVTAVSRMIDKAFGPVVVRTLTSESHDGGGSTIRLKHRPVSSVTAVSEFTYTTQQALAAESTSAKTANDYLLEAAQGVLRRRHNDSDASFAAGRQNVQVTYVAGRYSSTGSVDAKFKQAAAISVSNLWRREQGGGTETFGGVIPGQSIPGFGLPFVVMDLLSDEMQAPEVG